MDTEQNTGVVPVGKLVRSHLFFIPFNLALAGLSFPSAMNGGWSAGIVVISGISMLIEAQSAKVTEAMLEQVGQPKPAWLDFVRFFALASGPMLLALGIWLLFRR